MYLGLNIPATLIFTIVEKLLTVMVWVDIGIRPATLSPITHVTLVNFWFHLLLLALFIKVSMMMKAVIVMLMMEEVDLNLERPATIPFIIL